MVLTHSQSEEARLEFDKEPGHDELKVRIPNGLLPLAGHAC